jgi:hypothetical protein
MIKKFGSAALYTLLFVTVCVGYGAALRPLVGV